MVLLHPIARLRQIVHKKTNMPKTLHVHTHRPRYKVCRGASFGILYGMRARLATSTPPHRRPRSAEASIGIALEAERCRRGHCTRSGLANRKTDRPSITGSAHLGCRPVRMPPDEKAWRGSETRDPMRHGTIPSLQSGPMVSAGMPTRQNWGRPPFRGSSKSRGTRGYSRSYSRSYSRVLDGHSREGVTESTERYGTLWDTARLNSGSASVPWFQVSSSVCCHMT
jgi:hypothetical protein